MPHKHYGIASYNIYNHTRIKLNTTHKHMTLLKTK